MHLYFLIFINFRIIKIKLVRNNSLHQAGFEPAHPEIVGLKSTALDHSAIGAFGLVFGFYSMFPRPVRHTNTCDLSLNHFLCL
jgi:hypothetical protein